MSYLLDVNFLVALFDPRHVNHERAHAWFAAHAAQRWATCSITESGCVRVLSNPSYPTVSATPVEVINRLRRFCAAGGHSLWPDDVSLRNSFDGNVAARLQGYQQVTDFHLATLAARHGGHLATFDGRLRYVDGGERWRYVKRPLCSSLERVAVRRRRRRRVDRAQRRRRYLDRGEGVSRGGLAA